MKTAEDIANMSNGDYGCGLPAHYKPLAELVKSRGYKTGIEIGCAYGNNAEYLLNNTDIELLICIDPYIFYDEMPGFTTQHEYDLFYEFTKDKLSKYHGRVSLRRSSSMDAIRGIPINVDFCFIDGKHEEETVRWECDNYVKLIKDSGIISGHDYNIFKPVNKAVDEFAASINKKVNVLHGNIWYIEI
jgi:hypothetical protein